MATCHIQYRYPQFEEKMRTLISIWILLLTLSSFSQNIGANTDSISYAERYVNSDSKIDSIMQLEMQKKSDFSKVGYTRINCIGYGSSADAYLFWSDRTSTYLKKFEYNSRTKNKVTEFEPIKIKDSVFFSFYKFNEKELKSQRTRRFKYDAKNLKRNSVSTGFIERVHSCHRKFQIKTNTSEYSQEFDFFDLDEFDAKKIQASNRTKEEMMRFKELDWEMDSDTIYENHPRKNINFEFNQELSIVKWNSIVEEFIAKLESENMFKKLTLE